MIKTSVDFETYSEAPLMKVGAWAYSVHPSTEVLFMAYADGDDHPLLTNDPKEMRRVLLERAKKGNVFSAWNSFFEFCICVNVLGLDPFPFSQWQDTAAQSAALALPRALGACGKALGMPQDKQKDEHGKKLIQKLCKPVRGKRNKDFKLMQELGEYCVQDVIAERAIANKLRPLSPSEKAIWELDQAINFRGVGIDLERVEDAIAIRDIEKEKLFDSVAKITGGELSNVNSPKAVQAYALEKGYELKNFQKGYLSEVLEDKTLPEKVKQVVEVRLQTGKTSIAKYDSLVKITDKKDSRTRGLLRYHGASTGRWSGNLFQPQNLPRPTLKDPEGAVELFEHRDPELLDLVYGQPMEVLSSCVRSMITAAPGKRLFVCDFSQIEARVLPWLAGQNDILEVFKNDGKVYEHAAAKVYKKDPSKISSDQRQIGKVVTLACGYQGATGAFQSMAAIYGVEVPDTKAKRIVDDWRKANPKIVSFWYDIDRAAQGAVKNPGVLYRCRSIRFKVVNGFLFCRLPSGRLLAYYKPSIEEGKFGPQINFYGNDSYTKRFKQIETYGGKLVENITQAVARDCMTEGMLRVDEVGYDIILTVHDEIIAEVPEGFGSLEEFQSLMCQLPEWAEGLPLDGDGYEAKRYRK